MGNWGILGSAALAIIAFPASAQDEPLPSPLIAALEECLAISVDAERLACSDAAARRLIDASRRKEVVLVDREEMKKTRKSLFGFSLPRIGLFGGNGPDGAEEVDRLETKIVRVTALGYDKFSFTVEGGGRWNTTEAWADLSPPKAGAAIVIKRGAIGSYMITPKGGRSTRAMRVG